MPGLTFPPLDRRRGTRPPTCPDCGAAWLRGSLHACPPPAPAAWWARLPHRLCLWCSPPVAAFVVYDDEVPRPQPMPRPPMTGRLKITIVADQSVPGQIVVPIRRPKV